VRVRCCVCKKILGEKPPFEDTSYTDTYCPKHLAEVKAEIEALKKKQKKNPRRSKLVRHHNPPSRNPSAGAMVIGEIPGRIEEIRYRRFGPSVSKKMQGSYRHPFTTRGTKMLALSDGSLLIRNSRRKLWLRNDAE
jgi:hypothetical protein